MHQYRCKLRLLQPTSPHPRHARCAYSTAVGCAGGDRVQVQTALVVNTVGFGLLEATGKRGSILTASGALSAYLLGLLLWTALGSWGWGTCVLYLVAGSAVTKVKMAKKEVQQYHSSSHQNFA